MGAASSTSVESKAEEGGVTLDQTSVTDGSSSANPAGQVPDLEDRPTTGSSSTSSSSSSSSGGSSSLCRASASSQSCSYSPSSKRTTIDSLPDEVLLKVLAAVSASADTPADVVSPSMTCRRWRRASVDKEVLGRTSRGGVGIRPRQWNTGSLGFLQRLCDAGCLEACFMLGMILFYCIPGAQLQGGRLLLHTARAGHAAALHTAGIMSFNGSGWGPNAKDVRTGVALCARAAALGHADAMRELGHCLLDGYGVRQDAAEGWRLLLRAQLLELGATGVHGGGVCVGAKRRQTGFDTDAAAGVREGKRRRTSDPLGNAVALTEAEQERAVHELLVGARAAIPIRHQAKSTSQGQSLLQDALPAGASIEDVASTVLELVRAAPPSALPLLRPVLSQLESPLAPTKAHPAYSFLAEWFDDVDRASPSGSEVTISAEDVRLCGPVPTEEKEQTRLETAPREAPRVRTTQAGVGSCARRSCSRRETRPLEFWRCAECWDARYCSRSCQLQDWKEGHSCACKPPETAAVRSADGRSGVGLSVGA